MFGENLEKWPSAPETGVQIYKICWMVFMASAEYGLLATLYTKSPLGGEDFDDVHALLATGWRLSVGGLILGCGMLWRTEKNHNATLPKVTSVDWVISMADQVACQEGQRLRKTHGEVRGVGNAAEALMSQEWCVRNVSRRSWNLRSQHFRISGFAGF